MTRNRIALAATSALTAIGVFVGSLAYAQSDTTSADELKAFLDTNPQVAAVVSDVEAQFGGKVVEAEFDDEQAGNGVVEFELAMADGSEQEVYYTLADGTMVLDDDMDDDEDDEDEDESTEDGETADDK